MPVRTIDRLLSSDNADLCARGLRQLARALGDDSVTGERPPRWQELRDALSERGSEARLLALAVSSNEVHRELAALTLGAWRGDAALPILLKLTEDDVVAVRATALGALRAWPEDGEAREILLVSMDDGEWIVRMQAALALGPFVGSDTEAALMEGLIDPHYHVRSCSAESLKCRDVEAVRQRLRGLFDHPAPHIFDAALDLLGDIGTEEDASFLARVGSWRNFSQPSHVKRWARDAAKKIRARLSAAHDPAPRTEGASDA